jgi:hypothetical protein
MHGRRPLQLRVWLSPAGSCQGPYLRVFRSCRQRFWLKSIRSKNTTRWHGLKLINIRKRSKQTNAMFQDLALGETFHDFPADSKSHHQHDLNFNIERM